MIKKRSNYAARVTAAADCQSLCVSTMHTRELAADARINPVMNVTIAIILLFDTHFNMTVIPYATNFYNTPNFRQLR